MWRHTHTFEYSAGGARITDHVEYAIPLRLLGGLACPLVVTSHARKMFDYREVMPVISCITITRGLVPER